ncbi:aflatoxin B1 aldehyde reductase member 3 [Beauveria brongniartii RCEF 3172]|uniref:Aflatoxin B1 aldehyde reductase member 3 n=1 Tax=Beauveria brongniartii RCEF 3172 TaxID=1081107 RepID=A0A167JXI0_9HYPO|nr:aflatoxin B1 aldehyde reductase member 3 [Beauveria brongniartii RCEF 3172]
MSEPGVKIVFGSAGFMSSSVPDVEEWLTALAEVDITAIDTAEIYGMSEQLLGDAGAGARFTIDTKAPGGTGTQLSTGTNIIDSAKQSLKKLKVDAVDVYYLHAPDRRVPLKDTLSGLNKLHQQGVYKRLGLSNFLGHEVEEVVRVAHENNFVVPSVYQGNYSAIARRTETEIFPILRKHNIAFYAYSPIAGGFLSKSRADLTAAEGRFGRGDAIGNLYNSMYNRPSLVAALDTWERIAEEEGVTRAELAYRWIVHHSKLQGNSGDAVIVGARKVEQLRDTVKAIKNGPLSDGAVGKIEDVWETVKSDSFLDNFEAFNK